MIGYFVLGGPGTAPPLFTDTPAVQGNHTQSPSRGHHALFDLHGWTHSEIHIPARDKKVDLWMTRPAPDFEERLKTLDSQYKGQTYTVKLANVIAPEQPDLQVVVLNTNIASHGSLAICDLTRTLMFFGIRDTHTQTAYLFWGAEFNVRALLISNPLRYEIYRFPHIPVVFIASETLCAKWWRWTKNNSLLRAFNALEMRLVNGSPL